VLKGRELAAQASAMRAAEHAGKEDFSKFIKQMTGG